jgi:hypothetical protein
VGRCAQDILFGVIDVDGTSMIIPNKADLHPSG